MDLILTTNQTPESFAGMEYEGIKLTQELIDEKVYPALRALDDIDPNKEMEYATETRVGFGIFFQACLVLLIFLVVLVGVLLFWIGNLVAVLLWMLTIILS
jgi:hypothetical protein